MNTMHKLAISAVATFGLAVFGATNLAQAGHPNGGGSKMTGSKMTGSKKGPAGEIEKGHGPVIKDKSENERKRRDEYKYWDRYAFHYGYPEYTSPCYAVETCCPQAVCEVPVCPQPVCEVPVCPAPVYVPTPCCEVPCSPIEICRPYEFRRPCFDYWSSCDSRHRERPRDEKKDHDKKPTTASSHRSSENLGSVASHTSGRGRK